MTAPSYTRRVFVGLTSSPKTPRASITWTELTDRMLSAQFRRGKSDLGGDFEPGSASIVLKNEDRQLDPDYDAGLVYRGDGKGLPGCPVKIVVTVGATDTILWFGYLGLEGWPVVRTVGADSTVTLNAMTQTAWMATQALPSSPWAAGVIGLDPDWWIRGGADTTSLSGGDHLPDSVSEGTTDQYAVVSGTGTVTIGSGLVNDDQDPSMEVGAGVRILSAGSDISPVTWGGGTGTKTQMVASCIWKADAQLVDHAVMSLFYDPTDHFRWRVYCDPYGQLVIVMTNAAGTVDLAFDVAPDNPADPDGRWDDGNPHIVTVKFVGSSKLSLWVDGQHVDLTTTVPVNYGYGDLLCGTTGGYSTIDEILWWNVAISDANILILHSWFLGTGAPLKGQTFVERAASLYELAGWVYDSAEEDDWHYVAGGGSPDPDLWGLGSVQSMPATLGEAQQQLVESYAGARWDTRAGWPRLRTAGALTDATFAADYATAIANLTDEPSPAGSPTPIRRGLVQKSGTLLDRVVNKAVGTYGQDRGLGVPSEDLVSITRKTQSSIDKYGVRPAEMTSQVTDGDYVAALVATAAAATAEPPVEIQAVEVEVNDTDSLAFVVDDLELEKLLTITDTPEVGDPWTADLQVQSEAHDWSPGRWVVTIGLALSQVRTGRARAITSSVSAGIRIGGAGLLPGSVTAKTLSPAVRAAVGLGGAASTSAIPTGPAGGDLDGTYPNPIVGAGVLDAANMAATGTPHGGLALLGDDTWGLPMPTSRRFADAEKTASAYLARSQSAVVAELWIGDSMGAKGASDAEQTSMIAVYEAELARAYNLQDRGVGFVPVRMMAGLTGATTVGIGWDTVAGTRTTRGPNNANRSLAGGQACQVTRDGSAVRVFFTAQNSGSAVAAVTINGILQAVTIDSYDATITDPSGYEAGHSVLYARPTGIYGPIDITVTQISGGAFELEGAYFYARNSVAGSVVYRADRSGQALSYINDTATPSVMQFVKKNLPKVITICLGVNDANVAGLYLLTAAQTATELTDAITTIRSYYSTWQPTIRYLFQNDSAFVPSTWETDYRDALRQVCFDEGVTFIDGAAAAGSIRSSDDLDWSDDSLHPNDNGHMQWGKLVADVAIKSRQLGPVPFTMPSAAWQLALSSTVTGYMSATGGSIYLGRDTGAATVSGAQLGALGFIGAVDAYGLTQLGAAVRGSAEENFTTSTWKSGLRFMTGGLLGAAVAVRGGFSGDGDFFVGLTLAAAKFSVDINGNSVVAGTLGVTGVTTFTAQPIMSSLTASRAVFTDGSKGLVSNAITGTGNVVMSASPTLTGTVGGASSTWSGTLDVTGQATATAGLAGGSAASDNLILQSTWHATRGFIKAKDLTIIGESVTNGNELMRRSTTLSGKEASSDSYFNPRWWTAAGSGVVAMWTKALPATTAVRVEAVVFGTNTNGASPATKIWSYTLSAVYNAGGLVAGSAVVTEREDTAVPAKPSFDASGGSARLKVQPPAATDNVAWHARITWQPITSPVNS